MNTNYSYNISLDDLNNREKNQLSKLWWPWFILVIILVVCICTWPKKK